MCNTINSKHEKNCLFANLCGHTIVDTYKNINTIKTKTNQFTTNLLHKEAPRKPTKN